MKVLVCYFSATGNGFDLAARLAEKLDADVRNIMTLGKQVVESYDKVVVVSSVYYFGLPLPVEQFIQAQAGNFTTRFYLVLHYAGFLGNARYAGYAKFKEAVLQIQNVYTLHMPSSYTLYISEPRVMQMELLKLAHNKILKIADRIAQDEKRRIKYNMFEFMDNIHKWRIEHVTEFAKDYVISGDCTYCGLCEKICPMKNISVSGKKVKFKNRCAGCMACFNRCPQMAIRYGKYKGQKRYQNPFADFEQMK